MLLLTPFARCVHAFSGSCEVPPRASTSDVVWITPPGGRSPYAEQRVGQSARAALHHHGSAKSSSAVGRTHADNVIPVVRSSVLASGTLTRSFDGVNDLVNVPDANTLDLTTGMTLSAWVRPTALGDWRTVMMKSRPGGLAYALYAHTDTNRPAGVIQTAPRWMPAVAPRSCR